jgi:hypothetical protein
VKTGAPCAVLAAKHGVAAYGQPGGAQAPVSVGTAGQLIPAELAAVVEDAALDDVAEDALEESAAVDDVPAAPPVPARVCMGLGSIETV